VPINVLVNNAGVMPLSPLHELKIDEWNRMIDVNIRDVLHGIAVVAARHAGEEIRPGGLYHVAATLFFNNRWFARRSL
jgi:NAD(P)-dependent dehydrogenase (short-subunit alcohol dehydrogenase family)